MVAHWGVVFAIFAIVFLVNYSVLPLIDHRYRAVFYPGNTLAATLTQRFHDATGTKLRYVVGAMWDGGNLAHYSPDQPEVLIDGLPRRAPWIDLADLRKYGAIVVWSGGDTAHLPAQFASRRRQCRGRRAVRPADAPRRRRPACRLGDPEAAVKGQSAGRAETSACDTSSGGGFSPSTTRSISSDGRRWSVTICGQRRHIAGPSWWNQRHCRRIAQCGSLSVTSDRISTLRTASWHASLLKCGHAHPWHFAAKRNTSLGDTGPAMSRSSGVTSSATSVGVTRGASGVPPTTPINTDAPG